MSINQRQLLCPRASFELFLASNGGVDVGIGIEMNQLVHVVLLGKPFVHAGFMLAYAPGQVVGHVDVEDGVVGSGEQVDVVGAHGISGLAKSAGPLRCGRVGPVMALSHCGFGHYKGFSFADLRLSHLQAARRDRKDCFVVPPRDDSR